MTTYGTTFGHNGGVNDCIVDETPMNCFEMRKEFRKYKRKIMRCNPCWLIQKDYQGNKLREGYAMRIAILNHHHYWFGELITYNSNGDTVSHQIDTNYILDELVKLSKRKIEKEIRKKGNSITW